MKQISRRDFAALTLGAGAAGVSKPAWARSFSALSLESYSRDSFAGYSWGVQKADRAYAITEDLSVDPRRHRFEVRRGDAWKGNAYINRAEFSCLTRQAFGEDVWFSYAMRVAPGVPVTNWNVLGQFHHTPDDGEAGVSPPFAINFTPGEKLRFIRRYNPLPLDSQPTVSTMYTKTIARDRWYRIVGMVRFGWQANGAVRLWIDGAKVLGLSNIDIGYNDAQGPYWKFGIYRRDVPETLAVEYANFELSSSSLAHRVAGPLPLPA